MNLTEEQIQRYSRHVLLPEVGGVGQERLLASSVLIAFSINEEGAAALALVYLAAAGVGRIGWCPLDGFDTEGGRLRDEFSLSPFLGACGGVQSLNPDARFIRYRPNEVVGAHFDLLVWLGDESVEDFAAFKAAKRIVVRGAVAEILEGSGASEGGDAASPGREAQMAATQGVLGAWLAARALRRLVDGADTVGSTTQARFDLSRGATKRTRSSPGTF